MNTHKTYEWLHLKRTVRFGETDSAGVIHFVELLRWCHEAWEESLQKYGVLASSVFPRNCLINEIPEIAFPIIHCEADFFRPIYVGDDLELQLFPERIDFSSFLLKVQFNKGDLKIAFGQLKHVAIHAKTREKVRLTEEIDLWLEDSSFDLGIKTV